ncbi:MAG: hypothetical protein R3Y36_02290 [Spirochaetales bacterium]
MEKTVLIAGMEYPFCETFVNYAVQNGHNAMVTLLPNSQDVQRPVAPIAGFAWNRSSPISARSLVLETENTFGNLDYAFIVFDTVLYTKEFEKMNTELISRATDTLFSGYMYLCSELLEKFIKKGKGNLCFILKKHLSLIDGAKSKLRSDTLFSSPLVMSGEAAFQSFAEGIAVQYASSPVGVYLIESSKNLNEASDFNPWLYQYLEAASTKPVVNPKNASKWIAEGTKFSAGWQLFNK